MNSKTITKEFYNTIGKEGLSERTRSEWDSIILSQVEEELSIKDKILDVGCGYGRISLPLLEKGYNIYGIDISERLINELQSITYDKKEKNRFKVSDMCTLPFEDNSFDKLICLWSAFNELLYIKEQVKALKEMYRVLRDEGAAFIEGTPYRIPTDDDVKKGKYCGYKNRIGRDMINGLHNYHYNHDEVSLIHIMKLSEITNYNISQEMFGGRIRQIIRIIK